MAELSALWLPILLSAALVFVVSSVIHMVIPWHKNDFQRAPAEDRVMEALRPLAIPPGDYMLPRPGSTEEMRSAEFKEKFSKGPVMVFTVMPAGEMGIGRQLILWFIYCLVVGFFSGYVASAALPRGADYLKVFQFVGTAGFLGYAVALWQMTIWYRKSWITTLKSTIDGLLYALLTAGMFGWLWPR